MNKGPATMFSSRIASVLSSRLAYRPSRRLLGRQLLLVLLALLATTAAADANQVNVGLLGIDGASVESGMGQALTEALRNHIPTLHGMRAMMSQQDLAEVKLVFGCTDENPSCMAKVGRSLGVNRLIYGSIRRQLPGGQFIVAIKQLNVADSTVEKFITEAVPAEVLKPNNPQLNELVQRWLHVLLIEGLRGGLRVVTEPAGATVQLDGMALGQAPVQIGDVDIGEHVLKVDLDGHVSVTRTIIVRGGQVHEVTATLPPRGQGHASADSSSTSRILRITSYVSAGLAGISAIAAIGTWRGYVSAQDGATSSLDSLQRRLMTSGQLGMYSGFFGSSSQLSSCAAVPGLQSDIDYQGYLGQCQHGNDLARATTALWVVSGTFAVISVTTALLSALRKPSSPSEGESQPAASPPSPPSDPAPMAVPPPPTAASVYAPHLKLVDLSPNVGPGGAAVSALFSF